MESKIYCLLGVAAMDFFRFCALLDVCCPSMPVSLMYSTHVHRIAFRDTETSKGTQTVQPIVLVELDEAGVDVKLDATSERYRWIGLCPLEAETNGEDRYVLEALNRLKAWNPHY